MMQVHTSTGGVGTPSVADEQSEAGLAANCLCCTADVVQASCIFTALKSTVENSSGVNCRNSLFANGCTDSSLLATDQHEPWR